MAFAVLLVGWHLRLRSCGPQAGGKAEFWWMWPQPVSSSGILRSWIWWVNLDKRDCCYCDYANVRACFFFMAAGDFSPQQLVRFIETDRSAWGQLRSLLRTYDDCVRTGDGTRYKRPSSLIAKLQLFNQSSPLGLKVTRSFSQDNQTWKNILQTLVENHQMKPDVYWIWPSDYRRSSQHLVKRSLVAIRFNRLT